MASGITKRAASRVASAVMAVIRLGVNLEHIIAMEIRLRDRHKAGVPPSETNLGKAMAASMTGRLQVAVEEDRLMASHAVITDP
jgi:hypothetical protein